MNPIFLQSLSGLDLFAQIIGVIAVTISCVVFLGRKRKTILLCKFTTDVLWFWHYFLIGAYSGATLNILALFREGIFMNKEKKWASSKFWLYLIMTLTVISCLLTW